MLSNRFFQVFLDVVPYTLSKQFCILELDDIALAFQVDSFSECVANLEADLERMNGYFRRWRLQPNPTKTETCVFHLSTHDANRVLDVQFANTQVQHVDHPKYLGFTLARSIT
jgi:hypothetical protein